MEAGGDDKEIAVNSLPLDDGKAVSRLLDHCRMAGRSDGRPLARDRLEAALGGELARRLVGALAGDHRVPARLLLD